MRAFFLGVWPLVKVYDFFVACNQWPDTLGHLIFAKYIL